MKINFSLKQISLEGHDEDGGYKIRLALVSSSANIFSCTMLWGCNTQMLQKMKVHGSSTAELVGILCRSIMGVRKAVHRRK